MKPEARPACGASAGLRQSTNLVRLAELFDIAQRLFLDGREAAGDVALGGLAFGQVVGLLVEDHLGVVIEHRGELGLDLFVGGLGFDDVLGAGQFAGFAEAGVAAQGAVLVDDVADGGAA